MSLTHEHEARHSWCGPCVGGINPYHVHPVLCLDGTENHDWTYTAQRGVFCMNCDVAAVVEP